MLRCVVAWTCDHGRRDFEIDPDGVDLQAVLSLTDSCCPQCGRQGAAVILDVVAEEEEIRRAMLGSEH